MLVKIAQTFAAAAVYGYFMRPREVEKEYMVPRKKIV